MFSLVDTIFRGKSVSTLEQRVATFTGIMEITRVQADWNVIDA